MDEQNVTTIEINTPDAQHEQIQSIDKIPSAELVRNEFLTTVNHLAPRRCSDERQMVAEAFVKADGPVLRTNREVESTEIVVNQIPEESSEALGPQVIGADTFFNATVLKVIRNAEVLTDNNYKISKDVVKNAVINATVKLGHGTSSVHVDTHGKLNADGLRVTGCGMEAVVHNDAEDFGLTQDTDTDAPEDITDVYLRMPNGKVTVVDGEHDGDYLSINLIPNTTLHTAKARSAGYPGFGHDGHTHSPMFNAVADELREAGYEEYADALVSNATLRDIANTTNSLKDPKWSGGDELLMRIIDAKTERGEVTTKAELAGYEILIKTMCKLKPYIVERHETNVFILNK